MKVPFLIGMLCLLGSLLLVGCGVSQYNERLDSSIQRIKSAEGANDADDSEDDQLDDEDQGDDDDDSSDDETNDEEEDADPFEEE